MKGFRFVSCKQFLLCEYFVIANLTIFSRSLNVSLPRATLAFSVAWWKQSPSQATLVFGLLRYARNDKSQATLKNPIEEQASGLLNKTNRNGLKRHHDLQKDYRNL